MPIDWMREKDKFLITSTEYNRTRKYNSKAAMIVDTNCCGKRTYVSQTIMLPDSRVICDDSRHCTDKATRDHLIELNA